MKQKTDAGSAHEAPIAATSEFAEKFSLSRACETCRYWENTVKTARDEGGECRYGLPVLDAEGHGRWPATHGNEWCRCWKSDAEVPKRKAGRPVEHKPEELLPIITELLYSWGGMGRVDLYKKVYAQRPLSFSTFCKVLDALEADGKLVRSGSVWWVPGQEGASAPAMEV